MLRLDDVRPSIVNSVSVFCASWIGRYVPSSLPYIAGKFILGAKLGHKPGPIAASVLYENLLVVSVGAATSAMIIPLTMSGAPGGLSVLLLAGIAGLGGLLVLSPPVFHRLLRLAAQLLRRDDLGQALLSGRSLFEAAGLALAALFLNGAGFALILWAFIDLSASELVAAGAIFNLAGVAGIIVLPVPSGIGVREAVLIGLLQVFVPLEIAAAAAVVVRLGGIGVDLAFGMAGGARIAVQRPAASAPKVDPVPQFDAA